MSVIHFTTMLYIKEYIKIFFFSPCRLKCDLPIACYLELIQISADGYVIAGIQWIQRSGLHNSYIYPDDGMTAS